MYRRTVLAFPAAFLLRPASAQSPGKALTAALASPPSSLDPHFYNGAQNNTISMHLYDRLTELTADTKLAPGLATSWQTVEDDVWEFKLRPGVQWHDGQAFTADDVAFTVERIPNVPNSPGGFNGYIGGIEKVEVVDPLTVRFHMRAPAPNFPADMALTHIISRHAGEGASTADFNSGKAAIGTGPYRLVSYTPGDRVELARNDAWWGEKQPWERATLRVVVNAAGRVASLLSGDFDVIEAVPAASLDTLQREQRSSVTHCSGLRAMFLQPNYSRTGPSPFILDNAGNQLPRNPMLDLRVRQALSIAVDRKALADRLMHGMATPTAQWMPPGTFGYAPSIEVPDADSEHARRLITEAGFPDGFRLTLHASNDRYPNDAATAQAVAQMWTRVGVKTQVEALPGAMYVSRGAKQEYAIGLWGWSSAQGEAGALLVAFLMSYNAARGEGPNNHGRYSNPQLDGLARKALSTLDDAERERLLIQAVEMAMGDAAIVPLYLHDNFWATKKGVTYTPRMDQKMLITHARPA
ncbi:ABC transporter substrate-binding protein [Roseomonas sp. ACRSG]|nr:ABC transporter substrate-binding protein [Roseomonas sp. ACRSG]